MTWLTISNIAVCIMVVIHFACEFGHYIHSYYVTKRDKKNSDEIKELIKEMKKEKEMCPYRKDCTRFSEEESDES